MSSEPTILHADLDSFYASVEQRDDPSLRGRPVIVGGGGVVLAASYEAKAFGIRTPMPGRRAKEMCPQAIFVPPRFAAYSEASKAVFDVFHNTTPLVEGISIDEAFLEVGGLRRLKGSALQIAQQLRIDVAEQVGLPISVGVARTKFLAKVASAVSKPDGLLLVEADRELEFLHPLPIERLWGVGKVTSEKLRQFGIDTVGDIAAQSEASMVSILGSGAGRHLYALSHNHDARRVELHRGRKSVGAQQALGRGEHSPADVDAALSGLVDRVTGRMRKADRTGRTVVLRLRFGDFSRVTRSMTLRRATAETQVILDAAKELLDAALPLIANNGISLIGVSVTNIERDGAEQLELQFDNHKDDVKAGAPTAGALDLALDGVHNRFGAKYLTRGVLMGRGDGTSVPLLPD